MSSCEVKKQVSRWILEFLVRNPATIAALPPGEDADPLLLKGILLCLLECELSAAVLTESALEVIEYIDDLDALLDLPAGDAIRGVYCAVAVECTVRFLVAGGGKPQANFMKALERIWEKPRLEKHRLSTIELSHWKHEVEEAVRDAAVCEKLVALNTRNDALFKMRAYLEFEEHGRDVGEETSPLFCDSCWELEYESFTEPLPSSSLETVSLDPLRKALQMLEIGTEHYTPALFKMRAYPEFEEHGRDVVVISSDTEESDRETFPQFCDSFWELEYAHEALRSNSLELKKFVTDPLPEALRECDKDKAYKPAKIHKRRKRRKWTVLEEETLRAGVQKFDTGNWKLILNCYGDRFEDRTAADLKDKWRNMTR